MTTYRLFPSTNGPASSIATGNSDIFNTGFKITSWGTYLDGYWWWRADSGQPSGAQKFCIWQMTNGNAGTVVTGSIVTSSTPFVIGWNYIPLPAPIPLSVATYRIATGLTGNFPFTSGFWGTGGPGINGITNGPLFGFSDTVPNGGTAPDIFNDNQCSFTNAGGNDPTITLGASVSSSFNAWQDVQIDDVAPSGVSYRLFPNYPTPLFNGLDTADNFTLGVEFILSQACTLNKIWFYSPPTVTQLPTVCGIWQVSNTSKVPGTENDSPSWSGAAASGWVSVSYAGITLQPNVRYKATVFNGAGTPAIWNAFITNYWSSGAGGTDVVTGPLKAFSNANATSPGQSTYHLGGAYAFPNTNAGPFNYLVDLEVTPVNAGADCFYPFNQLVTPNFNNFYKF